MLDDAHDDFCAAGSFVGCPAEKQFQTFHCRCDLALLWLILVKRIFATRVAVHVIEIRNHVEELKCIDLELTWLRQATVNAELDLRVNFRSVDFDMNVRSFIFDSKLGRPFEKIP